MPHQSVIMPPIYTFIDGLTYFLIKISQRNKITITYNRNLFYLLQIILYSVRIEAMKEDYARILLSVYNIWQYEK